MMLMGYTWFTNLGAFITWQKADQERIINTVVPDPNYKDAVFVTYFFTESHTPTMEEKE